MANIASHRIKTELREEMNSKDDVDLGVKLVPIDSDQLSVLRGKIRGPPETPYENGEFVLSIEVPSTYPFKPPEVRFQTKIWHPNISSQTGVICLDVLKNKWAASMTLRTVLLSIRALLATPEPNSPQDAMELFERTARFWTETYANGSVGESSADKEFQEKVQHLVDLGTKKEGALFALSGENWDVEKASAVLSSK